MAHLNLALCHSSLGHKDLAVKILAKAANDIDDDGLKDPKVHLAAQVSAAFNAGKILIEMEKPRSDHSLNVFLFPFCEKSLISLEGKSMTPHWGNTILFRSSQQLPGLRLGPSKGFLS